MQPTKVGIVGAGQLGAMLSDAAHKLGYTVSVLAANDGEPAALRPNVAVVVGARENPAELAGFIRDLDLVAFEQEFSSTASLITAVDAARAAGSRVVVAPAPEVFALCSDKLQQKHFLKARAVLTAPWLEWTGQGHTAEAVVEATRLRFPHGAVLKWARGGYDGRGTFVLNLARDAGAAARFIAAAFTTGVALFAEEFVPFVAELAVVSSRAADGRFVQYPTVRTVQDHGVCAQVTGPAEALGIAPEAARKAQLIAAEVGAALGMVGTYAVEFFLAADATLIINELAPRVHNAGHFSLDAAATSQFEHHWRALAGLPFGDPATAPYFGMVNIIGRSSVSLPATPPPVSLQPHLVTHWYGKTASRPGRKLGHVNVAATTAAELATLMDQAAAAIDAWHNQIGKANDVKP